MITFVFATIALAIVVIYRKTLYAAARGTEQKALVYSEGLAMDSQLQREQEIDNFKEDMSELKGKPFEEIKLSSSEDVFNMLNIKG